MYHNYYRNNEQLDETQDINAFDERQILEPFSEFDVLPEYEDSSVVADGFRSAENYDFDDEFVEFTPPFTCPYFRQQFPNPGGGFTPPRPPFGPPGAQPPRPPQGGHMNPGAMPPGPPPNYIPSSPTTHGISPHAVDPGAIRRCRFRFTYIWLRGRESFWAYITFVGRTSIAGFKWNGRRWVNFGIDLRRIESFICS